MAVATNQAITDAIYDRLTADSTMKARFGQSGVVFLYRVMAPQDSAFPYMVHDVEAFGWPYGSARYTIDLWQNSQSPVTVDAAAERIRTLLENWRITTDGSELGAGRMQYNPQGSGYIPTDNASVWRYSMSFTIYGISNRLTGLVG